MEQDERKPLVTLFGNEQYVWVSEDESAKKKRLEIGKAAEKAIAASRSDPANPVNHYCAGMLTYYAKGDPYKTVELYDAGIKKCPDNSMLRMCRCEMRLILRDFSGSISDGVRAADLIAGEEDHGLDLRIFVHVNSLGLLDGSFHYAVFYHLGLAYYFAGELEAADSAFSQAEKFVYANGPLCSVVNWHCRILFELGQHDRAQASLEKISDSLNILSNTPYKDFCLLMKGDLSLEEFTQRRSVGGELSLGDKSSIAYWNQHKGKIELAKQGYKEICSSPHMASWRELAAEVKYKELLNG